MLQYDQMRRGVLTVIFAATAMVLASCGQGAPEKAPEAPPAPTPETYQWTAQPPATVELGPPVQTQLSANGYAIAYMPSTAVFPGDVVTAHYTVQGPVGRPLRLILQRHCDSATGEDHISRSIVLTGEPQTGDISLTFEKYYSCIRLSILSGDQQPLAVTISDLVVTRQAAPQAPTPDAN